MSNVLVEERKIECLNQWQNLKDYFIKIVKDPWYKVIIELENQITCSTVEFYKRKDMKTLHLPVTTGTISSPMGLGSDSSPVKVNLFGVETYLADSMQFLLEYGCRFTENGCYYLMPSFRGEKADNRHLCQFYHSESEIPGTLDDVMSLVEEYIIFLSKEMLENCSEQIYKATNDLNHIRKIANLSGGFPRITYREAQKLLNEKYPDEELFSDIEGTNLKMINSRGEKRLIELFDGIVWLTHFEHLAVPFYQAFDSNNKSRALNADLLFGIGEVVGCGERHENMQQVQEALDMHEVSREEYGWYCDLKEIYPIKTAGFGMGVERFILWLLKHNDIRNCQIIPRYNGVNILP